MGVDLEKLIRTLINKSSIFFLQWGYIFSSNVLSGNGFQSCLERDRGPRIKSTASIYFASECLLPQTDADEET